MTDTERRFIVLQLWLLREPEKRNSNGVLAFYGWLEQNRPELVKRGHGDPYQQLIADLQGHILDPVKSSTLPRGRRLTIRRRYLQATAMIRIAMRGAA